MSQQFPQQQYKTKLALFVYLKGVSAPLALNFDNPVEVYNEIAPLVANQTVGKLITKEATGPIKQIAIMSNQIAAVAVQEVIYQ